MKKILVSFFLLLILPAQGFAASFSLQADKTSLNQSDELIVSVSMSLQASDNTLYYLRGVFSKQGSSNYCGYTWNGSSWYSGPYTTNDGWKSFLPIAIQNNSWTGQLKAKLDSQDSGCKESGNYVFKVERFTTTGSGSFDSQNELAIAVTLPTPSPTLTPTTKPTPTLKQTPTTKPTFSPTPQKIVSTSIGITPTVISSISLHPSITLIASSPAVLGSSSAVPSFSPTEEMREKKKGQSAQVLASSSSLFMITGGVTLLIACGILAFHTYRKRKNHE